MTYVGEYKERLRDGHGTYTFPCGLFSYSGEWYKGEMHGQGVFTMGNNNSDTNNNNDGSDVYYEGEFQNGEIEGIGLKQWANGSSYSGQFHRGEMHGEGVFISHTGEKYEGQWRANQRFGNGELVYANGDVYTGDFVSHKPHGRGEFMFADTGNVYEGDWESGKILGNGVLSDREGNKLYEGEWLDGQREGKSAGAIEDTAEIGALGPQEPSRKAVWYDGFWKQDHPVERTSRLVVKIVGSGSSSAVGDQQTQQLDQETEEEKLELLDFPPTVSVEHKKLPQFVVLSMRDDDREEFAANLVAVQGESRRQIRFRVFEGQYVPPGVQPEQLAVSSTSTQPLSVSEQENPGDVVPSKNSTQWQFVLERDDASASKEEGDSEGKTQAPAATEQEDSEGGEAPEAFGETQLEQEEERLDEVVVGNVKGKAHFQRLALPATTLPGNYHILCESMASSDLLDPVAINLSVV